MRERLYLFIATLFSVVVIFSNLLTGKLIAVPYLSFGVPAGLLLYPFSFLLCDLTVEIFGKKEAEQMVYTGFVVTLCSYLILAGVEFLPHFGPSDVHAAYTKIFFLQGSVIVSSLIAMLAGQLIDVRLYSFFLRLTNERFLGLRANVSMFISQAIDSFLVNFILFYIFLKMPLPEVLAIALFSYAYKGVVALIATPLFYAAVYSSKRLVVKC